MAAARDSSPAEIRHLRPEDARVVPWKNGRGVTEELALWPPGAAFERGDFDWRLSRAAVDEDGPFSSFPGFERVLVVTSGAGLRLEHGAAAPTALVARLRPYAFPGDWASTATLIDGPVADFSLLIRRGAATADVAALALDGGTRHEHLRPGHAFVHVLAGTCEARWAGQPVLLAAGESLWRVDAPSAATLELSGRGELLLVRIESPRPTCSARAGG